MRFVPQHLVVQNLFVQRSVWLLSVQPPSWCRCRLTLSGNRHFLVVPGPSRWPQVRCRTACSCKGRIHIELSIQLATALPLTLIKHNPDRSRKLASTKVAPAVEPLRAVETAVVVLVDAAHAAAVDTAVDTAVESRVPVRHATLLLCVDRSPLHGSRLRRCIHAQQRLQSR